MATADLMELKELATRQKLRELKEAMSAGKTFMPLGAHDTSEMNGHVHNGQEYKGEKETNVNDLDGKPNNDRFRTPPRENTFVVNGDRGEDSQIHNSSVMTNNEFYAQRKSEKDPTSKWESSYSRPTTPSNLAFQTLEEKKSADHDVLKVKFAESTKETDGNKEAKVSETEKRSVLTEDDILEIQSKRFEKELNNRTERKSRERSLLNKDHKTYMPSEYVHDIANADEFDARKMNLSSKNFDSALTSMLGQESNKIYPDTNDYEQFARTSKYRPNPYLEPHKTVQQRPKGSRGQKPGRERSKETRSAERLKSEPDAGVCKHFFPRGF